MRTNLSLLRRQSGQSSMEYVVICAAIALTLGLGLSDDQSALWQLIQNFRLGYEKFSFALSLPT